MACCTISESSSTASSYRRNFGPQSKVAVRENISLYNAERQTLGFTHCDTGKLLADYWNLPPDVHNVIEFHHAPEQAPPPAGIVAVVNLADWLCRLRGMGYGYDEVCEIDFHEAPAWNLLEVGIRNWNVSM